MAVTAEAAVDLFLLAMNLGPSLLFPCKHVLNPRFACLSRLLKYLGGHLKSLKLFKTQHNVALKRLRSKPLLNAHGDHSPIDEDASRMLDTFVKERVGEHFYRES